MKYIKYFQNNFEKNKSNNILYIILLLKIKTNFWNLKISSYQMQRILPKKKKKKKKKTIRFSLKNIYQ